MSLWNRSVPRGAFVRGLLAGVGVALLGGARRVLDPAASLAASTGVLVGNIRDLLFSSLIYTDPKTKDPAILIQLPGDQYVSYDAICKHAGCTVGYDPDQQLIICPCHGSTYDPAHNAKVLVGPATKPLSPIPVRVDTNGDVYALDAQPKPTATATSIPTPTATPTVTPTPTWATYDASTHTAHLNVIAAYGGSGHNFDGGTHGRLLFTVPLHAKVVLSFQNHAAHASHGIEIVPYSADVLKGSTPLAPAFRGAALPNESKGLKPDTGHSLTFTASKPGRYLLVCPVKGHIGRGEWAVLVVSKTAKTAKAVLKT